MRYYRTIDYAHRDIEASKDELQRRLEEATKLLKEEVRKNPNGKYRMDCNYRKNGMDIIAKLWVD